MLLLFRSLPFIARIAVSTDWSWCKIFQMNTVFQFYRRAKEPFKFNYKVAVNNHVVLRGTIVSDTVKLWLGAVCDRTAAGAVCANGVSEV